MKNYNEMADDVLRRIGEYETAQKRKRRTLTRAAASCCALALVVLVGVTAQRSGLAQPDIQQTLEDALYPGIPDVIDDRTTPTATAGEVAATQAEQANVIIVNDLAEVPDSQQMDICLLMEDFVAMDKAELNAYYGTNVFPEVPGDLAQWEDSVFGIYCRDGGTGEVYHSVNILNYSNEDFSRYVYIEVKKGELPFSCCIYMVDDMELSLIGGVEVAIGQWEVEGYFVEFLYRDVGFRISTEGITQEELVAVILSLIGA